MLLRVKTSTLKASNVENRGKISHFDTPPRVKNWEGMGSMYESIFHARPAPLIHFLPCADLPLWRYASELQKKFSGKTQCRHTSDGHNKW